MISLLLPSRARPDNIVRLRNSAAATAVEPVEMIVRLDEDDPRAAEYPDFPEVSYFSGPRVVLSEMWNECWRRAQGPVFMQCGDDIEFQTPGWDQLVTEAFPPDGIAFVHGDDLSDHGSWLGTHGFLRREWTDAVGYFVPPLFSSDYNDLWLTHVADMLERRFFVPMVTEHHHPAFGKAEWDVTHQERIARHHADDVDRIWRETAHLRFRDAKLLEAVMA